MQLMAQYPPSGLDFTRNCISPETVGAGLRALPMRSRHPGDVGVGPYKESHDRRSPRHPT